MDRVCVPGHSARVTETFSPLATFSQTVATRHFTLSVTVHQVTLLLTNIRHE